jgi:cation/acetate symporter
MKASKTGLPEYAVTGALLLLPVTNVVAETASTKEVSTPAVLIFVVFIAITLVITWWAARRTREKRDFYTAGSRVTGLQNGLAIAGDFMSAATILGITGLIYTAGFDAVIYILSPMFGFFVLLVLLAEPFRNLGRFTIADVAVYRLDQRPVRAYVAVTSLAVVLMYLISQMVGAGALIQLLFGIKYSTAVVIIGGLMVFYVSVGGMMATTWVQIIKAVLMLIGITLLAIGTMHQFDFSFARMYREVAAYHPLGARVFAPGVILKDGISTMSLTIALTFGFLGLPHIVMRLFTVPDVKQTYRSVLFSTVFIGYVFIIVMFIIGYGAIVLLHQHPELYGADGGIIGGNNMVTMHLSKIVGGELFLGFMSAIVFATILAVVSGLTLAGASALSHDIYNNVLRHGQAGTTEELRITRFATVLLGIIAIGCGILFERQNIAFMISMVFAISASANFPLLILSIYWRGLTTRGAIFGGLTGLILSVGLIILGPAVWVNILGHEQPLFPYSYPAIISMPAAFLITWIVSVLDHSPTAELDRSKHDELFIKIYTGTAT